MLRVRHQEIATADNADETAQKKLPVPAHSLYSSGSMNANRPFSLSRRNRSHSRRAGACSRGLRFANTTLEKADFNISPVLHGHQLHVNPVLAVVMLTDFSGFGLPAGDELIDENHKVRIANRNRDPLHRAACQPDRQLITDL